jgi:hypothetical protein
MNELRVDMFQSNGKKEVWNPRTYEGHAGDSTHAGTKSAAAVRRRLAAGGGGVTKSRRRQRGFGGADHYLGLTHIALSIYDSKRPV